MPFAAALVDLALQPGVRYRWSPDGSAWTEARVTASGNALGETAVAGTTVRMLHVDDTTYAKMPATLLGVSDDTGLRKLEGRWVTGVAKTEAGDTDTTPQAGQSPSTLANLLLAALASPDTTVPDRDTPPANVDGTPALKAKTPAGDLFISQARPHRLLKFALTDSSQNMGPSASGSTARQAAYRTPDTARLPASGGGLRIVRAWATPAAAETFTIASLSKPEAAALRREIQDDTKQLADAVDVGISAQVEEKPTLNCSDSGCTVDTHITSIIPSSEAKKRLHDRQVTVELTATVTIEGQPAGSCTATGELPLESPGDISCSDTAAGPVFTQQQAAKRRVADAEARATGRAVRYVVHSLADTTLQVLARVDTTALAQAQQDEEELAASAPAPADMAARDAPPQNDEDAPKDCNRFRPEGAVTNGSGWIRNSDSPTNHRTETGKACLLKAPNNSSTEKKATPPGYREAMTAVKGLGLDPETDLARCHIIAARFGGSNKDEKNLSPCGQRVTNNGALSMKHFEDSVADDIKKRPDMSVYYVVDPFFGSAHSKVPRGFSMLAIYYTPNGVPFHVLPWAVLNVVEAKGGRSLVNIGD